jgi:hypothetical protein
MPDRTAPLDPTFGSTPGASRTGFGTSAGTTPLGTTSAYDRPDAGGTMADVADKARQTKDRVVDRAAAQAQSLFDGQKTRATGALSSVADALRQTAQTLKQDQSGVAQYVDMAAERVADLAETFEAKDLDDVLYDVQSYARRNPGVFFGGALALGFLAARFMKATSRPSYTSGRQYSFDQDLYSGSFDRGYGDESRGYGGTTRGSSGSGTTGRTAPAPGLTYGEDL